MIERWAPAKWLRAHPFVFDCLVAAAVVAVTVPSLWLNHSTTINYRDADVWGLLLALGGTVPLAWRRRDPMTVFLIVVACEVAYEALGYPSAAGIAGVVAVYSAAAHLDRRRSRIALGLTLVGLAIVFATARWNVDTSSIISNVVIFTSAWLFGDNIKNRRAYMSELEARATRLEHEREEQARQAVADEQARIARELHDVIAHNVSVMVVQAGAARRILDTQPERAKEAIGSIETTGRQALTEMRRLLGVLRKDDEASDTRSPQPSIANLESLVQSVREAGLPVDVVIEGEPRPLASGVDLSAYRIVQEALTNTMKHGGPATATVRLTYSKDELELEVTDTGRGAAQGLVVTNGNGKGHGLVGMRERVALFGGKLNVGPQPGGGYAVSARLPIESRRD
jgi:signal transduction histidine kinase